MNLLPSLVFLALSITKIPKSNFSISLVSFKVLLMGKVEGDR